MNNLYNNKKLFYINNLINIIRLIIKTNFLIDILKKNKIIQKKNFRFIIKKQKI